MYYFPPGPYCTTFPGSISGGPAVTINIIPLISSLSFSRLQLVVPCSFHMPLPGTRIHPLAVRCPSMTPLARSLSLSLQGIHKAGSPPQHSQATITSDTRLTCSAGLRGNPGIVGPEEPPLCRLPCPDIPPERPGPPPRAAALLLRTGTRRGPRRPLPPSARPFLPPSLSTLSIPLPPSLSTLLPPARPPQSARHRHPQPAASSLPHSPPPP